MLHWLSGHLIWILVPIVLLAALWCIGFALQKQDNRQASKTKTDEDFDAASEDLFQEILRCTTRRGESVDISDTLYGLYEEGFSRWQRRTIVWRLVDKGWIEGTEGRNCYTVTDSGWLERQVRRMKDIGPKYNIHQDFRGAAGAHGGNWSVGSRGSVQSGSVNINSGQVQAFTSLSTALREDARSSSIDEERERALKYADQIDEAILANDQDRAKGLAERVKGFLDLANAAFTLTHDVIRQFFS